MKSTLKRDHKFGRFVEFIKYFYLLVMIPTLLLPSAIMGSFVAQFFPNPNGENIVIANLIIFPIWILSSFIGTLLLILKFQAEEKLSKKFVILVVNVIVVIAAIKLLFLAGMRT